jgi:hypothetical protein
MAGFCMSLSGIWPVRGLRTQLPRPPLRSSEPILLIWWPAVAARAPGEDHSVHLRSCGGGCNLASLEGRAGSPWSVVSCPSGQGPGCNAGGDLEVGPAMDADLLD